MFAVELEETGEVLTARLSGALTVETPQASWNGLAAALRRPGRLSGVRFLADGLTGLDLDGSSQILSFKPALEKRGLTLELAGLPEPLAPIWRLAQKALEAPPLPPPPRTRFLEDLGRAAVFLKNDLSGLFSFLGELLSDGAHFLRRPHRVRWKVVLHVAEVSGIDALPIVCLVSFLVGLILAFQAAMPMRLFGAEIYVADLIGISVVRELGPLITAIVLAGRSGSAFSAELGAMKAGQEIDALVTMGLSPVRDLVFPRVLATVLTTPMVTLIAIFMGLLGGNAVLLSMGYTVQVYWAEVTGIVDLSDYLTGLFKCFVFGFMVAMIGCQRGLAAAAGPGAVGEATTRGVVANIIAIVLFDSFFAVVFYVLGL